MRTSLKKGGTVVLELMLYEVKGAMEDDPLTAASAPCVQRVMTYA